jgi:uncharacterized protein HemY
MNTEVRALLQARKSEDSKTSYAALIRLFAMSEKPVPWAYEVWDELVDQLKNGDNHERAFAAQLLSRLAMSDPEARILKLIPAFEVVMRDERFVTARHTVQSIWRAGVQSPKHTAKISSALAKRYSDCITHKNASLIRSDIIETFAKLAAAVGGEKVEQTVNRLLASEADQKAHKKQLAVWRKGMPSVVAKN